MKKLIRKKLNSVFVSAFHNEMNPRRGAILDALQFIKYNQIEGDYLEFGCNGANTFRYAYDAVRKLDLKIHLYGFDSFEGLPEPGGIDIHPDFVKGKFCQSHEAFKKALYKHGIKDSEFTTIKGFYKESLTSELKNSLHIKKASLVYIDCDLYESTKDVLNYICDYLQTGTVICFDDYFCFKGDPDRGESLAKKEFLEVNSNIQFNDYFNYG